MQQTETAPRQQVALIWGVAAGSVAFLGFLALGWWITGTIALFGGMMGLALSVWVGSMTRLAILQTRMFLFTLPPLAGVTWAWRVPDQRFAAIFAVTVYFVWLQLATEKKETADGTP